jgi:antitoxin MazE
LYRLNVARLSDFTTAFLRPEFYVDMGFLWAIPWVAAGGANMITRIQRWGNSQGLRLARQVLEDARISVGDDVDVAARDGMIVIVPVRRVRGRVSLQEIVSRIPDDYNPEEMDWGKPLGKEVW